MRGKFSMSMTIGQYAVERVKQKLASAEESLPFGLTNTNYGGVNPDPNQAVTSMVNEQRTHASNAQFQNGVIQGSSLANIAPALNMSFPQIANAAMNVPTMGKTASVIDPEWKTKAASSGFYDKALPPDEATYNAHIDWAKNKVANLLEPTLIGLANSGEMPRELIPHIFGQQ